MAYKRATELGSSTENGPLCGPRRLAHDHVQLGCRQHRLGDLPWDVREAGWCGHLHRLRLALLSLLDFRVALLPGDEEHVTGRGWERL